MARKKKRSLAARYSPQVMAEAALRYGPELRQIEAEIRDAAGERDADVEGGRTVATVVKRTVDQVRPSIEKASTDASTKVAEVEAGLAGRLAGLSAAADAIKAASVRDTAGGKARLAERLASSRTELDKRKLDADAGATRSAYAAEGRFQATKGKLRDRMADIAREEGTFAAARTGQLTEGARDRSTTRRGQDKSAEQRAADRALRREDAAERKRHNRAVENKPKGKGGLSQEGQNKAMSGIRAAGRAFSTYKVGAKGGMPEDVLRGALAVGAYEDALGKRHTIPKVTDDLLVQAGFERARTGFISVKTVKALRAQGIRVPAAWRQSSVPASKL